MPLCPPKPPEAPEAPRSPALGPRRSLAQPGSTPSLRAMRTSSGATPSRPRGRPARSPLPPSHARHEQDGTLDFWSQNREARVPLPPGRHRLGLRLPRAPGGAWSPTATSCVMLLRCCRNAWEGTNQVLGNARGPHAPNRNLASGRRVGMSLLLGSGQWLPRFPMGSRGQTQERKGRGAPRPRRPHRGRCENDGPGPNRAKYRRNAEEFRGLRS